jgi:hypothetical protein
MGLLRDVQRCQRMCDSRVFDVISVKATLLSPACLGLSGKLNEPI